MSLCPHPIQKALVDVARDAFEYGRGLPRDASPSAREIEDELIQIVRSRIIEEEPAKFPTFTDCKTRSEILAKLRATAPVGPRRGEKASIP